MTWRPAGIDDAPAVAALARAELGAYGEAAALYAERITLAPQGCWVFEVSGTFAGHCISHPWRRFEPPAMHALLGALPADADCWYLHDVVVSPSARGSGAVSALMPRLVDVAASRGIDTLALIAVGGADRFWSRHGFVPRPGGAAGFGPDAVYMERTV